jgi:hypothetical protein
LVVFIAFNLNIFFYLKITLISPKVHIKKNERKPTCFFVKNDKYKFISFLNSVGFSFSGHIDILKGDDDFKKVIFYDDLYSKKYINFILKKNAKRREGKIYEKK